MCGTAVLKSTCETVLPGGGGSREEESDKILEWDCKIVGRLSNVEWTSSYSFLSSWATAFRNLRRKLFIKVRIRGSLERERDGPEGVGFHARAKDGYGFIVLSDAICPMCGP